MTSTKPNGSDNAQAQASPETKAPNTEFGIQRIYVKDLSFETPNSPQIFREAWEPTVNVELNVKTEKLDAHIYEVKLSITANVSSKEKTAFLAEVHQAGIFSVQGFNEAQLSRMLGSYCPTVLFPYAREVVSDLVSRGGFPPLYLAPINFEALYEQQLQQQTMKETTDKETAN